MGYYALHFLFTNIYHKDWAKEYLPTPKVAQTLPLVLSKDEVSDVLGAIPNFKHRAIIMLIYSTGARVSESVNIKLTDIDSKRMQVNIQEGKGLKQRQVPLSPVLLSVLRDYYKECKPGHYLFEGAGGKGSHLGISAVREICKKARHQTPNIKKPYTPHTFRHCFATHHLEQGTNLCHSSGFAGFVTVHRYKSQRGAENAKLPPSPAIVGYTMLTIVIYSIVNLSLFPSPASTIFRNVDISRSVLSFSMREM